MKFPQTRTLPTNQQSPDLAIRTFAGLRRMAGEKLLHSGVLQQLRQQQQNVFYTIFQFQLRPTMQQSGEESILISGHHVRFPYKPYPSQLVMMERVIKSLSRGENALLESATGTGKSLALLCGSLAWQEAEKVRIEQQQQAQAVVGEDITDSQASTLPTPNPSTPATPSSTPTSSFSNDVGFNTPVSQEDPDMLASQTSTFPTSNSIVAPSTPSIPSTPSTPSAPSTPLCSTNGCKRVSPDTASIKRRESDGSASSEADVKEKKPKVEATAPLVVVLDDEDEADMEEKKPTVEPKKPLVVDDDDDFLPDPKFKKINPKLTKPKSKAKGKAQDKPVAKPADIPPTSNPPTTSPTTAPTTPVSASIPTRSNNPPPAPTQPTPAPTDNSTPQAKKRKAPTIYFGTRTHTQIAQLVGELGRTSYRPRMCILASRDHYCINPVVAQRPNKNHEWYDLFW